jgi:hypothetical protein
MDDVQTLMNKGERAVALIYAHFKKKFGNMSPDSNRFIFLGDDQSIKN